MFCALGSFQIHHITLTLFRLFYLLERKREIDRKRERGREVGDGQRRQKRGREGGMGRVNARGLDKLPGTDG